MPEIKTAFEIAREAIALYQQLLRQGFDEEAAAEQAALTLDTRYEFTLAFKPRPAPQGWEPEYRCGSYLVKGGGAERATPTRPKDIEAARDAVGAPRDWRPPDGTVVDAEWPEVPDGDQ